jgi:hypothetical protein
VHFIVWGCLLATVWAATAQTIAPPLRLALVAFEDKSGFQGDWDLSREVPILLASHLNEAEGVEVIPFDSAAAVWNQLGRLKKEARIIEAGRQLGAEVMVLGRIKRFGVRRTMVGDPNLVGYKSYNSRIHLEDVRLVRVADQQLIESFEVDADTVSRPFELDLFGRPRKLDREFRALFKVEFDSAAFYELSFGQFTKGVFADLARRIELRLVERPQLDLAAENAAVLAVEGEEVFLGIGIEDGVNSGDILPVRRDERQVGIVKITRLIGPHLCTASIITGKGQIADGDRLGQPLVPGQDSNSVNAPSIKEQ